MAGETVFPERKRCRACARALGQDGAPVLLGLFCGATCAGMPEPVSRASDAPRECRTERDGVWQFKRRYRSVAEIPGRLREESSASWYWCTGHCGHLHIGHSRIDLNREQFRMLQSPADLADLLVKLRGKATRKEVAAVAGVRPIRIKELEEGAGHPDGMVTLFKVLGAYRVRPGVALHNGIR